jgi:tol-pal system protein YbgF
LLKRNKLNILLISLVFLLSGCATLDKRAENNIVLAKKTRLEAEASPYAIKVKPLLEESISHQEQAEQFIQASKKSDINADEQAKLYDNAVSEAKLSLSIARNALEETTRQSVAEQKKASLPVETDLVDEVEGPPGPISSAAPEKKETAAVIDNQKPASSPSTTLAKKTTETKSKSATSSYLANPPQDPVKLYQLSLNYYRTAKYIKSRQGFVTLLARYPKHKLAVNSQYWIGETYYAEGQFVLALGAFQAVINHYPEGNKVPDALCKVGLTEINLGRIKNAKAAFEECIRRFPKSSAAAISKKRLVKLK